MPRDDDFVISFDQSEKWYGKIEIGKSVDLEEGKRILLSTENDGRLIVVQLAGD